MATIIEGHDMEGRYEGRFLRLRVHVNTAERHAPLIVRVMRAARGPQKDATIFDDRISSREEWSAVSERRPCHPSFFRFVLRVNTPNDPAVIVDRVRRALRSPLVVINAKLFIGGPKALKCWVTLTNAIITNPNRHAWPE